MDLVDGDLKTTALNVFKTLKENMDEELKEVRKITYEQKRISLRRKYKKETNRYPETEKYI